MARTKRLINYSIEIDLKKISRVIKKYERQIPYSEFQCPEILQLATKNNNLFLSKIIFSWSRVSHLNSPCDFRTIQRDEVLT